MGCGGGLEEHARQREKHVQRACGKKVHGAFEELSETAEGKAIKWTGASGNGGPHEAPNRGRADCAGLKNWPEESDLYMTPLKCF